MTVRRGMADYRQAGAGGILFMGLLQAQGQEMTYEQRRILYRSLFSLESAKLEYDPSSKKDEIIIEKIKETQKLLLQAGKDYQSHYEGHQSFDQFENAYAELLAQILDNLWIIAIKAKLVENVIDDEKVVMA